MTQTPKEKIRKQHGSCSETVKLGWWLKMKKSFLVKVMSVLNFQEIAEISQESYGGLQGLEGEMQMRFEHCGQHRGQKYHVCVCSWGGARTCPFMWLSTIHSDGRALRRKGTLREKGDGRSWGCVLMFHVRKTGAHCIATESQWRLSVEKWQSKFVSYIDHSWGDRS